MLHSRWSFYIGAGFLRYCMLFFTFLLSSLFSPIYRFIIYVFSNIFDFFPFLFSTYSYYYCIQCRLCLANVQQSFNLQMLNSFLVILYVSHSVLSSSILECQKTIGWYHEYHELRSTMQLSYGLYLMRMSAAYVLLYLGSDSHTVILIFLPFRALPIIHWANYVRSNSTEYLNAMIIIKRLPCKDPNTVLLFIVAIKHRDHLRRRERILIPIYIVFLYIVIPNFRGFFYIII